MLRRPSTPFLFFFFFFLPVGVTTTSCVCFHSKRCLANGTRSTLLYFLFFPFFFHSRVRRDVCITIVLRRSWKLGPPQKCGVSAQRPRNLCRLREFFQPFHWSPLENGFCIFSVFSFNYCNCAFLWPVLGSILGDFWLINGTRVRWYNGKLICRGEVNKLK